MTSAVPDADLTSAYEWALAHAERAARGGGDELAERLHDAATDGVMRALAVFDPAGGRAFGPVCRAVVKARVRVARGRLLAQLAARPGVGQFPTDYDPAARPDVMPAGRPGTEGFDALSDDLRGAARLYLIDGFSLEDAGLLLGITAEAVRLRLRRAAAALSA